MEKSDRILDFVPQKEIVYNKYLPYADKLDEESESYLSSIKLNLSHAILRREIYPEAIFWTNHLSQYMELHGHKFSKDDHCRFIHLLFEILAIPKLPFHCVVSVGSVLYTLLKKIELLTRDDLLIDWRILHNLYERIFYNTSEQYGMTNLPSNIDTVVKGVIRASRPYFSVESTQEMLDEWRPLLCPFDSAKLKAINYFSLFFCTKLLPHQHDKGFKLWLEEFINIWETGQNSPVWENNLLWLFCRLARDCIGYIDWEPYIPMIFNRLMRSFGLPSGPNKMIVQASHHSTDSLPMLVWISSILGPESKCQTYLNSLFKALESYYHPSNNGRWMLKLQRMLHRLPAALIKRLRRERNNEPTWEMQIPLSHRISDAEITEFVLAIKPVVLLAMFSKVGSNDSCVALHNLSLLRPEIMIPPVIERLYSALETLTEPHRLIAALNCTGSVCRSMVQKNSHFPEGPSHVVPLLMGSLPGLDSNDMRKCLTTFHFLSTITNLVFLVDSSNNAYDDPSMDETKRELCFASAAFEDFVLQFMDRCFVLIDNSSTNQPARMDRNSEHINTEETFLKACLSSTFCSLLAHSSPQIYKVALQKLYTFVTTNIFEVKVSGKNAAIMCRSATKVSPELGMQTFMPYFTRAVLALTESEEVLQEESLDNELLFSLLVISEIVKYGSLAMLNYLDDVIKILKRTLHLKCQEGYLIACRTLYAVLHSMSLLGVDDYSSIPNFNERCEAADRHTLIDEWGQPSNLDSLGIIFHIPTDQEMKAIQQLLELFLIPELQILQKWASGEVTLSRDKMRNSLCIIDSCLYGAGASLPLWSDGHIQLSDGPVPLQCYHIKAGVSKDVISVDGRNFRSMIFDTIDTVLEHMLQVAEDDIKSQLYIISIYHRLFFYWGETKEDFEAKWKGFQIVKKALTDKLHGKKQHIRILLVDRILLQHYMREVERNKSHFTERHRRTMHQLFKLSTSHYHNVRSRAQSILQVFLNSYPYSYKLILPQLLSSLSKDPIQFHEEFKGALYVMLNFKHNSLLTARYWDLLSQLWPTLVSVQLSEKLSIIRLLDIAGHNIPKHLDSIEIELKIQDKCIALAKDLFPLDAEASMIKEVNEMPRRYYNEMVERLVSLIKSGTLHWRLYQLAFTMLSVCIRTDIQLPASAIRLFVFHLVHDTLTIRKIAISAVSAILQQHKRKHTLIEIDPFNPELTAIKSSRLAELLDLKEKQPSNTWLQYNSALGLDKQSNWDKWVFVHKAHVGFTAYAKPFKVYAGDSEQPKVDRSPEELSEGELPIYEFFMQPECLDKLIGYLSLEERKGHDRFDIKRFTMLKGLFRNYGDTFLPLFLDHLRRLVNDKQESSQKCAAEIAAGMIRGSKHWSFHKMMRLRQELSPILVTALKGINPETLADWAICFSTSLEGRDPNKYFWVFELLMEGPHIEERGSFLESGWLYILLHALISQEWRACELLHRMLNFLLPKLNHSYQNVREKVSGMLSNVFLYDTPMPNAAHALVPKRADFFHYILPRVAILESSLPGEETNEEEPMEVDVSDAEKTKPEAVKNCNHRKSSMNEISIKRKDASNFFSTICRWLKLSIMRSYHVAPPELFLLLPVLCAVQNDTSDETLHKEYTSSFAILSQVLLCPKSINAALSSIKQIMEKSSWHSKASGVKFLQHLVFTNIFSFLGNEQWLGEIKQLILQNLHDQSIEVREAAAEALSGLLHCEVLKVTDDLLAMFRKKCSRQLRRQGASQDSARGAQLSPEEICTRHAGILGLCACVNSFPYDVPDFMPGVLVLLADHLHDPQPIPTTIKKTLSNFRRTHHDSWRDHKLKFTEDQLAIITDWLVSPSYYA